MNQLIALVARHLKEVNTTVICPICNEVQTFKLDDLSLIRIGNEEAFYSTVGLPMIQCKHCKAHGKTTLIRMNAGFYREINEAFIKAVHDRPVKYVDASFEETQIVMSR